MSGIRAFVGARGANVREDVLQVQQLLNLHRKADKSRVTVDGIIGPQTLAAISAFQKARWHGISPDGLVEPGRNTWLSLSQKVHHPAATSKRAAAASSRASTVAADDARLSGARWWHAN